MPLRLLPLIGALVTLGCNGPTFLLPGGALEGETAATPSDWSFAGESGTIQLETNPSEPYSVNLAYTVLNGQFYINAGGTETQWAQHMKADPRVRLRLEGKLYELKAQRVTDGEEILQFAEAWTSQSMFRRDPSYYEEVWLYRLVPR